MRLIVTLILLAAVTRARRYRKCGPVDSRCLPTQDGEDCPRIPFCPTGLKRKWTENGCCCVLRDSLRSRKVLPENIDTKKAKILAETFEKANASFKIILEVLKFSPLSGQNYKTIKKLSKVISDAMKQGIIDLADLADIEHEQIFKLVLNDPEVSEVENAKLVQEAANEIFEKGNGLIEKVAMVMEERNFV